MKDIPEIDLSRMTELPKCSVLCRNTEELDVFFANAQKQLGQFLYWDYDDILDLWNLYKDKTGFTLFVGDYTEPDSMSYCDEEWFRKNGYDIIEFSDIAATPDIEESDEPVGFLLGGIV